MANDETPEQARRRKEQEALALLLFLLIADTKAHLIALCGAYLANQVSIHSLARNVTASLLASHTTATYYGRRKAGAAGPPGPADAAFAAQTMQGQSQYITGLLNDLGRGRYPDKEDGTPNGSLVNRLGLHADRLLGTANEAWVLSLNPDDRLRWVLGFPETEHCQTCPERAANSPYRAGDVTFNPGDGTSECGTACLCHWYNESTGLTAFSGVRGT